MSQLRNQMIRDMQLRRLSPNTQEAYTYAVYGLSKRYMKSPDILSDQQVQDYVLYMLNDRKLAWSTVDARVAGLQFLYGTTLGRQSMRLAIPPRRSDKRLPEVLSAQELLKLFAATNNFKHRVLLKTTYSAGLRVSEVVHLKLTDIDSHRMMIRVEQGKGNKDRYTLLSQRLLQHLRAYWRRYHPPVWLFPGRDPNKPLGREAASLVFRTAKQKAGIHKHGGIHSLRHSFGTHLLEADVDVRTIQIVMGHKSVLTTMRYLQITCKKLGSTQNPLDLLDIPDSNRFN